jgi:hypothetical protein
VLCNCKFPKANLQKLLETPEMCQYIFMRFEEIEEAFSSSKEENRRFGPDAPSQEEIEEIVYPQ